VTARPTIEELDVLCAQVDPGGTLFGVRDADAPRKAPPRDEKRAQELRLDEHPDDQIGVEPTEVVGGPCSLR
jgi:hypothetical protein